MYKTQSHILLTEHSHTGRLEENIYTKKTKVSVYTSGYVSAGRALRLIFMYIRTTRQSRIQHNKITENTEETESVTTVTRFDTGIMVELFGARVVFINEK